MGIVESEVAGQLLPGLGDALVGMQVDVLVFHALPQSLDEHVVDLAPLAAHADLDLVGFENLGEVVARELAVTWDSCFSVGVRNTPIAPPSN